MAQSELREAMLLPLDIEVRIKLFTIFLENTNSHHLDMEARLLLLEKEHRLLRPLRLLSLLFRNDEFSSLEGRSRQEIGGSVTRQL